MARLIPSPLAGADPTHPALCWQDEVWSYAELHAAAAAALGFLQGQGLGAGARVALLARPCPAWVALAHAAMAGGITLIPLNLRLTAAELAPLLARADLVVVDEAHRARLGAARGVPLEPALAHAPVELPAWLEPGAIAAILFTSGTTGQPKGAMLTAGQVLASAEGAHAVFGLGPGDRWLLDLPLCHVGGYGILWRMARAGGTVVLRDRFDQEATREAIQEQGVTLLSLVPAMLRRLLDAAPAAMGGAVRAIMLGGAPIAPDLVARCPQALASYGLTETCSHVTLVRPGAGAAERATAGRPLPGVRLRIVDEAGQEQAVGQPGAIELQGPMVFAGYLDDPAATAAAFRDGWLRTGDDGSLDAAGCLTVLSRRSDLIISGGENVYPAEVEAWLEAHPAIAEAAVAAVPDPYWGAVPAALLVWRDRPLGQAELEGHLAAGLARYKHPQRVLACEALPRLANGKVDRRQVASRLNLNSEFPS